MLHHVWQGGGDANDADRLAALTTQLAPRLDPAGDAVKQALRDATAQAIEAGLFGVPTLVVDGLAFWGLDALEMVAAYLRGDPWFDAGGGWHQAGFAASRLAARHAESAPHSHIEKRCVRVTPGFVSIRSAPRQQAVRASPEDAAAPTPRNPAVFHQQQETAWQRQWPTPRRRSARR